MPINQSTVDAALAAMEEATTLDASMIAFLDALPPDTPLRDATAALKARTSEVAEKLASNVPPPPAGGARHK